MLRLSLQSHACCTHRDALHLHSRPQAEYHLGCLIPPVLSTHDLPEGEWFCPKCAVVSKPPKASPFPPSASRLAAGSPRSTLAQSTTTDPYSSDLMLDGAPAEVAPAALRSVTTAMTADPYSTDLMLDEVLPSPGQSRRPAKPTPTSGQVESSHLHLHVGAKAEHAQAKNGIAAAHATDTTAKAIASLIGGQSARRRQTQAAPDSADGDQRVGTLEDPAHLPGIERDPVKDPQALDHPWRRKMAVKTSKQHDKRGSPVRCTAASADVDVTGTATIGADRVVAHATAASPVPRSPVVVSEPLLDLFDPAPETGKAEWGRVVSDPAGKVVIEDLYEDEIDIFC